MTNSILKLSSARGIIPRGASGMSSIVGSTGLGKSGMSDYSWVIAGKPIHMDDELTAAPINFALSSTIGESAKLMGQVGKMTSEKAFRKIHEALGRAVETSLEDWEIKDALDYAMTMRQIEGHTDVFQG